MVMKHREPPIDKFYLVYIFLALHGIGCLLPWNVFINAREYYVNYKLNTSVSADADYRANFLNYVAIAAQLPNLLMAALNTFYQSKTSTSNPTARFMVVMIMELIILLFTTIMVFVDTSGVPVVFFGLTMVSVVLINCCVGIHQTLTFGLAAYLPMKYSNAVITGSNACGVVVASVNMITKGISQLWGQSEKSIIIATASYFSVATLYVIVCVVTFVSMQRLDFFRYYMDMAMAKDGDDVEKEALVEGTDPAAAPQSADGDYGALPGSGDSGAVDKAGGDDVDAEVSKSETLRNCFAICCFSGVTGRVRCANYWRRYWQTLKECWPQCLNVWMVFTCTLAVFPAVQALVVPLDAYFIPDQWFVDVTCFFFFNLFAMVGCIASGFVKFPGPRFLWVPVLIRLVCFITFFMVSNYRLQDGSTRSMPLWVLNDHAYVFGSIVFAFTGGYFSSLAMMFAPGQSPPERAGLAGLLASFFLIFGVFSGCYLSRVVVALL